jgi:hypothetical protein
MVAPIIDRLGVLILSLQQRRQVASLATNVSRILPVSFVGFFEGWAGDRAMSLGRVSSQDQRHRLGVDFYQADGPGWQKRINAALRKAAGFDG